MAKEPADWARLGSVIDRRMDELGLTQSDVQARGGPSPAKVREIVNGRSTVLSPSKRRDLERALEWAPNSIDLVLAGGEPRPFLAPTTLDPAAGAGTFLQAAIDASAFQRDPLEDRLMNVVHNYDVARAEMDRLEWEYSRLRGIDIDEASDELDAMKDMVRERRLGRPWTPPWDPAVAETYGPHARPWQSYWWGNRAQLLEQMASSGKIPTEKERAWFSLDRTGLPENPVVRRPSTDQDKADLTRLERKLDDLEARLSVPVAVDQAAAITGIKQFATEILAVGSDDYKLENLAWILRELSRIAGTDLVVAQGQDIHQVLVKAIDYQRAHLPDEERIYRGSMERLADAMLDALRPTASRRPSVGSPSDYELAARDLGDEPVGRKVRRAQDEAGELPDPEGPEGGA